MIKKVMKRIAVKHYREIRDCLKKGMDLACVHEKESRRLNDHHKKVLETVSGSHYDEMRTKKSTISCMKNKLDDAMLEKNNIIISHNTAVWSAAKDAKPPNAITTLLKREARIKSLVRLPQTYL